MIENKEIMSESEQVRVRFEKLKHLQESGENPYKNEFYPDALASQIHQKYDATTKEELETLHVIMTVAGRVMAIRNFGKAAFIRLQDRTGIVQLYVQKDKLSEKEWQIYQTLDLGDIVGSQGKLFRTKTNELSLASTTLVLLTKSLRPMPEKFHGLTDIEIKYRQRYLDLMTNPESREVFKKRSKIVEEVRKFFIDLDFMEVETPMMHSIAGGAAARPFVTHHNTLDMELYLRIAPELYLKRLVVGGFERVFEINRNFRNEGVSIKHNPEFTMLEFYMTYATFKDLMDLTEKLFKQVAQNVLGTTSITYQGTPIDLGGSWKRLTVEDAVMQLSGFSKKYSQAQIRDPKILREYAENAVSGKIHMDPRWTTGECLMAIFDAEVEAQLIQPTFITHYPTDVSPLSRLNEKDAYLVDRFEIFIYGREMGNAFSELNDPVDQKRRFQSQVDSKNAGNVEACDMDEDYVVALEYGMPPTAGQGIGIDRLVMLLTDSASIRDVIFFPQMRPVAT